MGAVLAAKAIALMLAAAPICFGVPILHKSKYQNMDYQFSVRIPPGMHGCKNSSPCPNHGVWIPLQRNERCNSSDEDLPYIGVFANYNAAGLADTAAGLAAVECRWRHARHIVWLKGERLGGRKAAGCRRRFPDGHIEVTLRVLRKTNRNFPLSWIEVDADLITTPARYTADMRVFRRVVRGVWVHPDGLLP